MSEDPSVRPEHPEELLAAYVEGSASAEDRAATELHLASCPQCRRDVDFARAGHAALASLPPLEAPGLAPSIMRSLPSKRASDSVSEGGTGRGAPLDIAAARARRRSRLGITWPRVAWGAGLAAAAAAVAVTLAILITSVGTSTRPSASKAAAPEAPGAGASAAVVDRNADYTTASLTALADRLVTQLRNGSSFGAATGPVPSPAPADLAAPRHLASAQTILTCLRRGGSGDGTPEYLESATFNGTPVYVGAFLVSGPGTSTHLVVLAVTRDGCQPAFFSTHRL